MLIAIKEILTRINYLLVFLFMSFLVFIILVMSTNTQLIFSIISYPEPNIFSKLSIIVGLIGSIQTNFTFFSIISMIVISILFGFNISAIFYLIKEFGGVFYNKSIITTGGGILSAILGGGCAACGTLVITPLLSLVGLGGVLSLLPFGGQEFNLLAILFLGISFLGILKKIKIVNEKI